MSHVAFSIKIHVTVINIYTSSENRKKIRSNTEIKYTSSSMIYRHLNPSTLILKDFRLPFIIQNRISTQKPFVVQSKSWFCTRTEIKWDKCDNYIVFLH